MLAAETAAAYEGFASQSSNFEKSAKSAADENG